MKYLLVLYQKNGCDYTIGCGTAIIRVDTCGEDLSIPEIEKQCITYMQDNYGWPNSEEYNIEKAEIYIVSDYYAIDLQSYRDNLDQEQSYLAGVLQEEQERALLERLKRKYESC